MRIRGAETLGHIKLNFTITFSLIASVVLLALTFWYWHEAQSIKDTLIFFLAGAAAVGQVTASFYMARVLAETLQKDKRDLKRAEEIDARETAREATRLKQASIAFGQRWNDPTMYHARDTLRTIVKKHHSSEQEEVMPFIEAHETNVIHIANFFEEIGTAVRHNVVVPEIMQEQFDGIVVETWAIMFPWIKNQRAKNSGFFEDFERLYDTWK